DPLATDGSHRYVVGPAGTVSIEVVSGKLTLVSVDTNEGWVFEVETSVPDSIEVEFERGEDEAEIKVKLDDGKLEVEIKSEIN
ncbi:MAG TPA: hypothetical protein VIW94_04465, partial [Acidimicrobiia bacterium]